MSGGDPVVLSNLCTTLSQTHRWHASSLSYDEFRLLKRLLAWPTTSVFPVLDLLRLVAAHPDGASKLGSSFAGLRVLDMTAPEAAFLTNASDKGAPMPVQLMALRFSCNLLANRDSRTAVATQAAAGDEANNPLSTLTALAAALTEGGSKTNKNVSSAAASLLVNIAIVCSPAEATKAGWPPLRVASQSDLAMNAVAVGLKGGGTATDDEVTYRLVLAADTLMRNMLASKGGDVAAMSDAFRECGAAVESVLDRTTTQRTNELAQKLTKALADC